MTAVAKSDPSVGQLLGALARNTGVLVRQEVQLASSEMVSKTSRAGRAVGLIAAGGALAHAGFIALMIALFVGFATLIPIWLSALGVGLLIAGAGYAVMHGGMSALREIDPMPQQTVKTIRDDTVWAKEQLR